jgi:hypothetical protein
MLSAKGASLTFLNGMVTFSCSPTSIVSFKRAARFGAIAPSGIGSYINASTLTGME